MPKVGMQPIRRSQLIQATLEAVDQGKALDLVCELQLDARPGDAV